MDLYKLVTSIVTRMPAIFWQSHQVQLTSTTLKDLSCIINIPNNMINHKGIYRIQGTMWILMQRLNRKEPKTIQLEPVVPSSDYYFSKIGEVPQCTYLRISKNIHYLAPAYRQFKFLRRSRTYISYKMYDLFPTYRSQWI